MKRTILRYWILFIFLAQHHAVYADYSYLSQSHTVFIPWQKAKAADSSLSTHLSTNTKLQKNYALRHLTPTQQQNIINNWIDRYFKPNPIPYGQLPPVTQATETSTPALHENATKGLTPPTESLIEKMPYINDLETAIHIQQLSPEWEKYPEILDARSKAIKQIKNGDITITTQHRTLSHKIHTYCKAHDINPEILMQCSGTILQHTIHQEFVTITKTSSKIWHASTHSKPLRKMTNIIADFTCAGLQYNNNNEAHQAIHLANACWMLLDCIQAAGEGLLDGGYHLLDDVMHPIRTAQTIVESAAICGYYIGKVAIEVGQLGYLAIADNSDEIHKKLDAWKQNFSLIYEAIKEKSSELKAREIVKETVSFGMQCYAAPKVLQGLGKLFKQAHKQIITFAKNIPALKKTNALTTPEGVIIRIAENTAESMKIDSITTGNTISPKKIHLTKNQFGRARLDIENPVLNNIRSGSALKQDALHAFSDIIDNYATHAKKFQLKGGDNCIYELYQIEGSLNGKSGIFEWIIDPNPINGVTHRRFIEGVPITGKPNAIKKRL